MTQPNNSWRHHIRLSRNEMVISKQAISCVCITPPHPNIYGFIGLVGVSHGKWIALEKPIRLRHLLFHPHSTKAIKKHNSKWPEKLLSNIEIWLYMRTSKEEKCSLYLLDGMKNSNNPPFQSYKSGIPATIESWFNFFCFSLLLSAWWHKTIRKTYMNGI